MLGLILFLYEKNTEKKNSARDGSVFSRWQRHIPYEVPNLSVSYQRQARRLIAALMLQYIPTQSLGAKDSVLTKCANVNFSSSRQLNDKLTTLNIGFVYDR